MTRSPELKAFLTALEAELSHATGPAAALAAKVIPRWQTPGTACGGPVERLPVCDHIAPALGLYGGPLATAFAALEGLISWKRRVSASPNDASFWNGHANAGIFGPGGLEDHLGLWIGATIMAPHTVYPEHDHPPEEVYVPLSPGEWWNADMAWNDPGQGGFVYNPPGIKHAMRAGKTPFLALWVLPL